uniref:Uncharacterized protein n=1 Tax=Bionectria ochroleuca TaxID=29856 RepID=A0A0B7KG05_BIOOC
MKVDARSPPTKPEVKINIPWPIQLGATGKVLLESYKAPRDLYSVTVVSDTTYLSGMQVLETSTLSLVT